MTRFELLRGITDVQKFSELLFDVLRDKETPEQITDFLSEPLTEKQLQAVQLVAESDNYPLSLDGKEGERG